MKRGSAIIVAIFFWSLNSFGLRMNSGELMFLVAKDENVKATVDRAEKLAKKMEKDLIQYSFELGNGSALFLVSKSEVCKFMPGTRTESVDWFRNSIGEIPIKVDDPSSDTLDCIDI